MASFATAVPLAVPYQSLFLVAGEPSGDLIGSLLLKHLKLLAPKYLFKGIGGQKMLDQGLIPLPFFDRLQVMGISDVVVNFPAIAAAFLAIEKEILKTQPQAVILIDYQTFNLRLAKRLRKRGYKGKIIQYVSPTVWAWKAHRIPEMAANLDLLLTLFPFEPSYFEGTGLKAVFVGHPLIEVLPKPKGKKEDLLTLFPGSRWGPIRKTFPMQIKAASRFLQDHPHYRLAISCANPLFKPFLYTLSMHLDPDFFYHNEQYAWMDRSKIALATSGTVTMELAWFNTPTVVFYGLGLFNALLAKFLFKLDQIPFYSMINIIAGKEVFPEKIKSGYDPDSVCAAIKKVQEDKELPQECANFWAALSAPYARTPSWEAAYEILKIL